MTDLPPPSATEPPPPAELRWLADALGVEGLLRLLDAYAGSRVSIPREPNQGSPLALAIGLDAARALARLRGGETWKPPSAKNWRTRVLKARGLSNAAIARRLGIDESTVARHLNPVVSHIVQMAMDFERA